MCYGPDASPPIDHLPGAEVVREDLVLTAADRNRLAAHHARSPGSAGPGIVILPDVRGLHRFYEELAVKFAEHGYDAVAIDYFGRTAGVSKRDEDFPYRDHVPLTTLEGVSADTAAAAAVLRSEEPARALFTVGFCFGGSNSWLQAAQGHRLAGAIGFYGNPRRSPVAPLDAVPDYECPILALMAGEDPGIPLDVVEEFRTALEAAHVDHEVVVYDGAPHSFFDRQAEAYAEASADAWQRVLAFISRTQGSQPRSATL
ncbi:MAG: dienelactone hydrolase family protein [Actinobacteria bacterium]|nr:dienelactone hydrolase family protein [Actinomycetota bacterium]